MHLFVGRAMPLVIQKNEISEIPTPDTEGINTALSADL